jgi:hypothetical protein
VGRVVVRVQPTAALAAALAAAGSPSPAPKLDWALRPAVERPRARSRRARGVGPL